tara:strand:- start:409 stop:609 length:201 start_codon:yes stop_codon:yes gene_type:complete
MKKLLVILLLTFTSLVYAGEGRYVMVASLDTFGGVYILDTRDGSVRFCKGNESGELDCSKPNEDKN